MLRTRSRRRRRRGGAPRAVGWGQGRPRPFLAAVSSERAAMLCGGEGRKELRGDGRDSLTHTAQDGRGSSRRRRPAPGRFPRRSERGGPTGAPGAGLGGHVGPGAAGSPGATESGRGSRRRAATGEGQWRRAAEPCPNLALGGRARSRPPGAGGARRAVVPRARGPRRPAAGCSRR